MFEKYTASEIEAKWRKIWQEDKVYAWDKTAKREDSFVIDTPPPTISGQLHMGHMFSYTQTDFVARFQRMIGKNVFYPIGFDDNGLPTERLVEKEKGVRGHNVDRDEFNKLCSEVCENSIEKFRNLFGDMALSYDWDQEYHTISPEVQKISQMSFLDLFNKGYIYRKSQPILWDPVDCTALSQADIEDKEKDSVMNDIIFKTEDGRDLIIATTRPELLPACVAVFFNPMDDRYKSLTGHMAISPLFNKKVPIIADEKVDIEKGTGLVMCCTFGDITDIYWWQTHNLDLNIILDKTGKITLTEDHFELNGLKAKEARDKIIAILKDQNLLSKQVEIKHVVKCAERSGAALEILTVPQWFVKVLDFKEELLAKAAEVNWYPHHMKIKLDVWIKSLNWDWCISRQRFMGVPFPVWYSKRAGEEGKILVPNLSQLPLNPLKSLPEGYEAQEVEPDYDVMDTWATSSVTPQINSKGIDGEYMLDKSRHDLLFPADLRPQAHEIIRSWAFYTIVKSLHHSNSIPWKNIMISGWCLASDKTKMSKSKGNVVTPESLIPIYSADVLRYWAATSRLGADTAFAEDVLANGKRFVNKLWNSAKFVSSHFVEFKKNRTTTGPTVRADLSLITHPTDLWILAKLNDVMRKTTKSFEEFEYCEARIAIEEFFWKDFCDNYLEIVKVRIYGENNQSAVNCLYYMFENILKLFAPFVPYITEEIYQAIYNGDKSIHRKGHWPMVDRRFDTYIPEGSHLVAILDLIRKAKAAKSLSIKAGIDYIEIKTSGHKIKNMEIIQDLKNVVNASEVHFVDSFSTNEYIIEGETLEINIKFSAS
jgi:valyl-tRNA synthetase